MKRGVQKLHDNLNARHLRTVPFDKCCGFCVMKKSTYREKLNDVPNSDHFQKISWAKEEILIKNEKQLNNSLQQLMKQGKISDKIYQRLRSTGHNQLYGLAKIHKKTPLWLVLSIRGSSNKNLNTVLAPFCQSLPGPNIETNMQDARKKFRVTLSWGQRADSMYWRKEFVQQSAVCIGYRNRSKRTLFNQLSSRYPKVSGTSR